MKEFSWNYLATITQLPRGLSISFWLSHISVCVYCFHHSELMKCSQPFVIIRVLQEITAFFYLFVYGGPIDSEASTLFSVSIVSTIDRITLLLTRLKLARSRIYGVCSNNSYDFRGGVNSGCSTYCSHNIKCLYWLACWFSSYDASDLFSGVFIRISASPVTILTDAFAVFLLLSCGIPRWHLEGIHDCFLPQPSKSTGHQLFYSYHSTLHGPRWWVSR
jgi:hypothetical protein